MISLTTYDTMVKAEQSAGIEKAIHLIRGQRVMLDSDLAAFYGITTRQLNQQLRRNQQRFPIDFAFELTAQEFANLRSQIATSREVLRSQTVISKSARGGRRYLPWVFTEHGVIMLASVLNSEIAIQASVRVVRAFVRLRELVLANAELAHKVDELERRLDGSDAAIMNLFDAIRQLLQPPPAKKREIGFHVREKRPRYKGKTPK